MIRTALILILLVAPLGADDAKISVVGTITGHDGKPVTGTTVKAFARDSWPSVRWPEADKVLPTRVGKDGKYRFTLEATGWYILAEAPGHVEMVHLVAPGPGNAGPFRCDFRLPAVMSIEGHVEDETGAPIVGAPVSVHSTAPRLTPTVSYPHARESFSRRSGQSGRFAFHRVAAGSYDLFVLAPHRVLAHRPGIDAGRSGLRIVLRSGKEIAGRVVNKKGDPVPDAWVVFYDGMCPEFCTKTDREGRFRTLPLPSERTYTVVAGRPGPDPPRLEDMPPGVDVKPGGKEITITLK